MRAVIAVGQLQHFSVETNLFVAQGGASSFGFRSCDIETMSQPIITHCPLRPRAIPACWDCDLLVNQSNCWVSSRKSSHILLNPLNMSPKQGMFLYLGHHMMNMGWFIGFTTFSFTPIHQSLHFGDSNRCSSIPYRAALIINHYYPTMNHYESLLTTICHS